MELIIVGTIGNTERQDRNRGRVIGGGYKSINMFKRLERPHKGIETVWRGKSLSWAASDEPKEKIVIICEFLVWGDSSDIKGAHR